MIVFRQLDEGYRTASVHWQAEYFGEPPESMFPLGTAYLIVHRGVAQLNFVLVADAWRRQGIATALIQACEERWPGLMFTGPMGKEGEELLRSIPSFAQFQDG